MKRHYGGQVLRKLLVEAEDVEGVLIERLRHYGGQVLRKLLVEAEDVEGVLIERLRLHGDGSLKQEVSTEDVEAWMVCDSPDAGFPIRSDDKLIEWGLVPIESDSSTVFVL
ncbi:hypothetical protein QE152_g21914 [Popillia japonica]|uniref:Uncharacterized protein n=1 Tax=Popillia japonica TaxID=7064 RepID=A0AAW1KM34_POPJA